MYPKIKKYCEQRIVEFDQITEERKATLQDIANYIRDKKTANQVIQLVYICTHNSRRSHFGQIWGAVAAAYYEMPTVLTYSGGTEATAFHSNALAAVARAGFEIKIVEDSENPLYEIIFGQDRSTVCFSKKFNDPSNPQSNFAAIMTCSDADENCPFIPKVDIRIATTYDDPKVFDGTELQDDKYNERCAQIAREILYCFSEIL